MRWVVDDPLTLALARMRTQRDTGVLRLGRGLECSMPACDREDQVGRYHDGELSAAASREFEAHLAGCAECARRLAELRSLSERLAPARELTLPQMQRRHLLDKAEAVARGGASPAADGPASVPFSGDPEVADENADAEREPSPMRIGPPERSVRWVKWLTAAAAAVFLFSLVQVFLTRGTGPDERPNGLPNGIPAIDPSTTRPAEGTTQKGTGSGKRPAAKGNAAQPERESDRQGQ